MHFQSALMSSLDDKSVGTEAAIQAAMNYCPTLMIGLGGTGAQVLLRVKQLLRTRNRGAEGLHRFLFIDTDQRTFGPQPGLPMVEGPEKCFVGGVRAKQLLTNPDLHPFVWKRFPKDRLNKRAISLLAQGRGASQIRSLGALALVLDYRQVHDKIETAYTELINLQGRVQAVVSEDIQEVGRDMIIYVVGSLSGGTGSGCFLDVSLAAKTICAPHHPKLIGMFALPEGFMRELNLDASQKRRVQANTYAALQEIQYVLDAEDRKEPITFEYGSHSTNEIGSGDTLFDLTYLVNDRNSVGRLPKIENLYDLIAQSVYQDVGSPLGAYLASFESNCHVLNMGSPCPITNRERLLGSIASTSLYYPAERVAAYCALRSVKEVLGDHLLGPIPKESVIENSVAAFLTGARLEERSGSNQMLDALLEDPDHGELLSEEGLSSKWGQKKSAQEFAANVRAELQAFDSSRIPEAREVVDTNRRRILKLSDGEHADPFAGLVQDYAYKVAETYGAKAAMRALKEVDNAATSMRAELEEELRDWNSTNKVETRKHFNESCRKLSGYGAIRSKLSKTDDRLRKSLTTQFNDIVQNEMWAIAKPTAIDLLNIFGNRVKEAHAMWSSLVTDLEIARKAIDEAAVNLQTKTGTPTGGPAVRIDVTTPGYEQRFYKSNKMKSQDALKTLLTHFRTRIGGEESQQLKQSVFSWLLRLEGQNRSDVAAMELSACLFQTVAPPILGTDLVRFVKANRAEVDGTLSQKLDLMFSMCEPFWPAIEPSTELQFPEFMGFTVRLIPGAREGDEPRVPPLVQNWIEKHGSRFGEMSQQKTMHGAVPYEIVLGRRTYGARTHYLTPVADWKEAWRIVEKLARGKYMQETHVRFDKIESLLPDNNEPLEFFALGIAFGFIVSRGDWYYFALRPKPEGKGKIIGVIYDTQWTTIYGDGDTVPNRVGPLDFGTRRSSRPADSRLLAHGREKAIQALGKKRDWMDQIEEAVNEYNRAVGNAEFMRRLSDYCTNVLQAQSSGREDDLLERERAVIENRIQQTGI